MTKLTVIGAPAISSVSFTGTKKLTVSGAKLGSAVRLVINNADKSEFITSVSDALIRIKGKSKKLGLKAGDNSVQVFDTTGAASNIFILRL